MEQSQTHLQETLLLPGEWQLEECIEGSVDTDDEGVARVEPGELREEEQDLMIEIVLEILTHHLHWSQSSSTEHSRVQSQHHQWTTLNHQHQLVLIHHLLFTLTWNNDICF